MRVFRFTCLLLLTVVMLVMPATSSAGILLSIGIAPPLLPVYEQPLCPGEGYIWTPGYWAYDDVDGYFWVPGTWVLIPEPGFLWTPGYWGWGDGVFVFHEGYWGPHIGFYGGIDYGFGYVGFGYQGGYWDHDHFFYNRAFNHVDHVTYVYNKTVVVNRTYVSYNGGAGGINARPRPEEEQAMRERHIPPSSVQVQHRQTASTNRQLFESVNHGKPSIAATARPAQFSGRGVVAAKSAAKNYQPPTARGGSTAIRGNPPAVARGNPPEAARGNTTERSAPPVHAHELPPLNRPTYSGGNSKPEQKYQQQQQKLYAQQQQERQKLQQRQEQEHQKLTRSNPTPQRQQQVEQKHQQQTQQMQQRHETQQRQIESRAPQARPRK